MTAASWITSYMANLSFRDGGRDAPYVDCFGLVRLVLSEEAGIDLAEWPDLNLDHLTSNDATLLASTFTTGFHTVPSGFEQAFDVAIIRRPLAVNGRLKRGWWHMGVVSEPGFILHMHPAQGVVNEPFRDTPTSRASATLTVRDCMFFRHESLTTAQSLKERAA